VAGAGHYLYEERPDAVFDAVRRLASGFPHTDVPAHDRD
jgi:hypothetical protein